MKCLRIDQIYLYLEKELSPSENKKVEKHLASCIKCKNAVEERKILLKASESLPLWEVPPDFTGQTMAQIFPEKVSLRSWLAAAAVSLSSIILLFSLFFIFSKENLGGLFINLGHRLLDILRSLSVLLIKILEIATLLVKIIIQFSGFLIKIFTHLTKILDLEAQIILIAFGLVLISSLLFGVRKKFMTGEKT